MVWTCDEDWVKKCMEYRVEGRRPVGRTKKTWLERCRERIWPNLRSTKKMPQVSVLSPVHKRPVTSRRNSELYLCK